MNKKSKIAVSSIAAFGIVSILVFLIYFGNSKPDTDFQAEQKPGTVKAPTPVAQKPAQKILLSQMGIEKEENKDDSDNTKEADVIASLQKRYGKVLFHGHEQVKCIEKIMEYLMSQYPDDWQDRMLDFLKKAFPDMADALFERYNQLVQYNEWLANNRSVLMGLSAKDRRDALWRMRYQIFGEDANMIWEMALKNEEITMSLEKISEARDMKFGDKLDTYMNAIRSAYEDRADTFINSRQTELMNKFISLESVQEDLRMLPPEDRKEKLTEVRKAMGLDNEAIQRWNDLDSTRDQQWDKGSNYESQRKELVKKYQGEEREKKLQELQEQVFGAGEAEIIRMEEESGFFRYDHQRIYGKE